MRFIFLNRFWFVYAAFVPMEKFKILAQFALDRLPLLAVSSPILFLLHSLIMWSQSPHNPHMSSLSSLNLHLHIIIHSLELFTSALADGFFYWSLSDSKSPQVSRTLLSILAVLNNAVVWMVSTRPPTSKSSSPFSNPLVTVPNAPITIGIIVTCMFYSFFFFSIP